MTSRLTDSATSLTSVLEPFEKSAGMLVDMANRVFHKRLLRHVRRLDITMLEWYVLRAIASKDGLSIKELGALIHRASCQLIGVIDKLEAKRFVRREVQSVNRRITKVFLTPAGEKFLMDAAPKRAEILSTMGLTREELDHLCALLEKMVRKGT